MSDILYDAKLWLEGRLRHTRTHWQDCHLAHGHAECLVRKLLDEIELLRGYRDEAESQAAIASLAVARLRLTDEERDAVEFFAELPWAKESGNAAEAAVLRGLLERLK